MWKHLPPNKPVRMTTSYRPKSIFVSDEVYTYLSAMTKALVNGTDAAMTVDQYADNYLREKITRENPELVGLHDELEARKKEAHKGYTSIEERMMDAVGVAKVVEAKTLNSLGG